ncbi:MAG: hypothetical protein ISP96_05125 [Gammaproteobacteria bacterium]|nr:hypothetical protein [Gammaproteobacteria bacterium]
MNKLLPILLVVGLAIIPELSFAYDRDSYEGYSSRTGGGGGISLGVIIMFLAFLFAYIMSPKEYNGGLLIIIGMIAYI